MFHKISRRKWGRTPPIESFVCIGDRHRTADFFSMSVFPTARWGESGGGGGVQGSIRGLENIKE